MPLKLLLDEDYRDSTLWKAIQQHNRSSDHPIDVVRVGDENSPALSSSDSSVLEWAEREERILISYDKNTLPDHLSDHLDKGRSSPGIIFMPRALPISDIVEFFELVCHCSNSAEWANVHRWPYD